MAEKNKGHEELTESRPRQVDRSSEAPRSKSVLREWIDSVVFAVVVVVIVRAFFFDMFRIPTPSMEKNLLVGDYLFVSKLHYGYRTPFTLGIPFTQIYLPGVRLPQARLPGFSSVKRGDAVVFNYPADRHPTDRKMHYIKRVVGMPGDSLSIRDKVVHVDGQPLPLGPGMQQQWNVYKTSPRVQLSRARLGDIGIDSAWARPSQNPSLVQVTATAQAAESLEQWPYIDRVEPSIVRGGRGYRLFPEGRQYSRDNYGPIPIPAKGQTVTLTEENWSLYQPVIERYEGHRARSLGGGIFEIDGEQTDTYTFEQDYFFVMGDNRDSSEDSRFWGYVPMDHVVGKAVMIYFSWDANRLMPRFSRIFQFVR